MECYCQFTWELEVGLPNVAAAIRLYKKMDYRVTKDEDCLDQYRKGPHPWRIGFSVGELCDGPPPKTILIYADDPNGEGNFEYALDFVRECAKKFDLTGRWGGSWSRTSSSSREDASGGGAVGLVLDDPRVEEWSASQDFLDEWRSRP